MTKLMPDHLVQTQRFPQLFQTCFDQDHFDRLVTFTHLGSTLEVSMHDPALIRDNKGQEEIKQLEVRLKKVELLSK